MTTRHYRSLSFAAALALAAVLLYYAVQGVEWRQVGRTLEGADIRLLVAVAGIFSINLLLRARRWRVLLMSGGPVSQTTAFWAAATGYFGNTFLPARAGELIRTLMVSSRTGLPAAFVLATALSERVADAIALIAMGALVLLTLHDGPAWLMDATVPIASLALLGAAAIAGLPALESLVARAVARLPCSEHLKTVLCGAVAHGVRGLRAFHDARRIVAFAGMTVVIWILEAIATVMCATSLGFTMPFGLACLLVASLGIGSALPSTPGYVGIYQFVAVTVLTPFGFSRSDAIAYILVAQAVMFTAIAFWGGIGMILLRPARKAEYQTAAR